MWPRLRMAVLVMARRVPCADAIRSITGRSAGSPREAIARIIATPSVDSPELWAVVPGINKLFLAAARRRACPRSAPVLECPRWFCVTLAGPVCTGAEEQT
jgi:hypothetical protein